MPTKGMFTQTAIILLEAPVGVAELRAALAGRSVVGETRVEEGAGWMGGHPGVIVAFRPEANGHVVVDVVPSRWPDEMGSPDKEPDLFGAWGMGFLGPFTFPGNLARAQVFAHFRGEAAALVERHRAFVRVSSSYVLGAGDEAKVLPEAYDPLSELQHVSTLARALLDLPGALAYFNPGGETLHSAPAFDELRGYHAELGLVPYALWSSVRSLRPEGAPGWMAMDTVGLGQLDMPDHEACFPLEAFERSEVANFLRNAGDLVRRKGEVVGEGDTMDGPGGVAWKASLPEQSLAPAPRRVVRWFPPGHEPPPSLSGEKGGA